VLWRLASAGQHRHRRQQEREEASSQQVLHQVTAMQYISIDQMPASLSDHRPVRAALHWALRTPAVGVGDGAMAGVGGMAPA
jgi:hypothetical protein